MDGMKAVLMEYSFYFKLEGRQEKLLVSLGERTLPPDFGPGGEGTAPTWLPDPGWGRTLDLVLPRMVTPEQKTSNSSFKPWHLMESPGKILKILQPTPMGTNSVRRAGEGHRLASVLV